MTALIAPRRRLAFAFASVLSLALLATLATAPLAQAPRSVSLKVKGPSVRKNAKFCKKDRRNMRVFKAGTRLKYNGYVRPAPAAKFKVSLKIEYCNRRSGRFVRVATVQFRGKRAIGYFKAFYRAPRARYRGTTYYKARVEVGGRRSNNRYYGIRR